MNYRILGKTGFKISEISLGTWQLGGKWGTPFDDELAQKTLDKAISNGVNFIDTADVYKATDSEIAVGKAIKNTDKRCMLPPSAAGKLIHTPIKIIPRKN